MILLVNINNLFAGILLILIITCDNLIFFIGLTKNLSLMLKEK